MNDLTGLTSNLIGHQRYIAILIDEKKIKSNLVFDKHSGELTGFIDLGDPDKNFISMNPEDENLASHALALYLPGACTDLKYILAFFTTRGVTSTQLFPIFWEAVSLLEMTCNLWVVAAASDGAMPNRIFYLLHRELDGKGKKPTEIYAIEHEIYLHLHVSSFSLQTLNTLLRQHGIVCTIQDLDAAPDTCGMTGSIYSGNI